MCYVGGPRCSNSAVKRYTQAKERYAQNPTPSNKELRRKAYNEFLLTPKGLEHLAEWRATAEQNGSDEQVDAIDTMLTQATNKRNRLLENNKRRSALKEQLWKHLGDKYPEKDEAFKILSKEGRFAFRRPSFYEIQSFAHGIGYRKRMPKLSPQDYYAFTMLQNRMDQQRLINSVETVDLDTPGSQQHLYPRYDDGGIAEVYYASYGSNLSRQRLMNYIAGGKPKGSTRNYTGCEDKTPPQDDIPLKVPHPLHFALYSTVWKGGIGFVDSEHDHKSLGRAYLVSSEQFEDIVSQESNVPIGESGVDIDKTVEQGKVRSSSKAYGTLVHIGDYNGRPVMTFTNKFGIQDSVSEAKTFWSTKTKKQVTFRSNRPSNAYLRMISSGLSETFGMKREDQVTYFKGSLGCESFGTKTLKDAIDPPVTKAYQTYNNERTLFSTPKDDDDDIENMSHEDWLKKLDKEVAESKTEKKS